jgi:lipopolysaccharide transport system permease protein
MLSGSILSQVDEIKVFWKLANFEVKNFYRRTLLGPFWFTLNIVIFSFAMTFVYGALFGIPTIEYASYVITGMISWQWFSAMVNDGGAVFINQKHHFMNPDVTLSDITRSAALKFFIIYLHQLCLVFLLIIFQVIEISLYHLTILPHVLIFLLMSVPVISNLGFLFSRFRDIQSLVNASMIIILMLTPIFWRPDLITGWRTVIVIFNPFHHMIEFLRHPMLGEPTPLLSTSVVVCIGVLSWVINLSVYRKHKSKIVFWV